MFRFQGSAQTYPFPLYPGVLYAKEKHCQRKGPNSSVRVHLHSLRSLSEAESGIFHWVIEKLVSFSWHGNSWRMERTDLSHGWYSALHSKPPRSLSSLLNHCHTTLFLTDFCSHSLSAPSTSDLCPEGPFVCAASASPAALLPRHLSSSDMPLPHILNFTLS